ncbi:HAMP domain-containing methyl-accepting chemotaxis protein [Methanospirillum lacunae]|uniref:Methyl-accepting chemotaxis protein n=1 Tax=Methanospirillum lacunae TaxID=668570 RepID=A0A2V2NFH8_9EURY|nr:methyl-accepting chemotaxis protein [Methanospirillum lacunae]PWR74351.1 methyl-accepting chemotaxis protein [Methanospirillum lacunae]
MQTLDDIKIGPKLIGSFLAVVLIMIIVGIVGFSGVSTTNGYLNQMYSQQLIPTDILERTQSDLWHIRGNPTGYLAIISTRDTNRQEGTDLMKVIDDDLSSYEPYLATENEHAIYDEGKKSWVKYKAALVNFYNLVDSGKTDEALAELTTGDLVNERKAFSSALDKLITLNINDAKELSQEGANTVSSSIILLIVSIIIGAIAAFSLGLIISKSITGPLAQGVLMMKEMSTGHLGNRLKMTRKDEIGELTTAMDSFSDQLQFVIIGGMKQIAAGDISLSITAQDEKDEIAPAFNQLIGAINDIIGEVGILISEAEEGRLKKRGETTRFTGAYQNIIIGINNMLDAITTPLNEALRVADLYSHAKFSARFNEEIVVKGDLIALKEGLNTIGLELSTAIKNISEQVSALSASSEEAAASVEEITSGSASVAQSSGIVSANADKSVNAVNQVLGAMEELNRSVASVASKVDSVNRLTQEANGISTKGVKQAAIAEGGITSINGAVNDVGVIINEIRDQMNEINKIVVIISDIADQTNLLALNAAIEAARAGDAGMGFAVVADEVKTLAQESQGSAENISKIITSLQQQSQRAASAMDLATTEVSKGSSAITETIQLFHHMAEQVEEISMHMTEVASLSEEESAAVEEITSSVSEVKDMATGTAEEAVSTAAATEETASALNQVSEIISNLSVIATRIDESVTRLNG